MNTKAGFTLAETLISLFLAGLIVSLLMQQFINTKKSFYKMQTDLEQTVDLHMAISLLRDSIHKAGFSPCKGIQYLTVQDQRKNELASIEAVQLSENSSLQINYMNEYFNTALDFNISLPLNTTSFTPLHAGDTVMIADCFHGEIQVIKRIMTIKNHYSIAMEQPLAFEYKPPVFIGRWVEDYFVIQKNKNLIPALYYGKNHAEELTSYIQTMKVKLIKTHKHLLVKIVLGLTNEKQIELKTQARSFW